jgi:nitrogen regulatory protein PII
VKEVEAIIKPFELDDVEEALVRREAIDESRRRAAPT